MSDETPKPPLPRWQALLAFALLVFGLIFASAIPSALNYYTRPRSEAAQVAPKLNDERPMVGDDKESQLWIDRLNMKEVYYPSSDPDDKYHDWRPPLMTSIYIVSDEKLPNGTWHIRKHEHPPSWAPHKGNGADLIRYYFPNEPITASQPREPAR